MRNTAARSRRHASLAAAFLCILLSAACGKKGAPLAPIVRIPAAVEQIAASRLGDDVYVTLTVPAENIDGSLPADLTRIDVYGYTGRMAPLPAQFAALGEVVASVAVAPPPLPGQPAPPPTAETAAAGAQQGVPVTVRDTLAPEELVQGRAAPEVIRRSRPAAVPAIAPPAAPPPLARFYMAIPFGPRGRPGPPGPTAQFTLIAPPDPPIAVRAAYGPTAVVLTWEPAGGLLGFLLDRTLAPEPLPYDPPAAIASATPVDTGVPPGPTRYNVYRELAPDPLVLPPPVPAAASATTAPVPLNPAPLATESLTDDVEFGRQRCYSVRAIRGAAEAPVISEPSEPACLTPFDIFPPAAPSGLATVPSEGGISLIWEPSSDLDLGGYLVLRGEVGDATLRLLTDTPVVDARFRDTSVTPGVRYVYAVVAVDSRLPLPNVSAESARVQETAR